MQRPCGRPELGSCRGNWVGRVVGREQGERRDRFGASAVASQDPKCPMWNVELTVPPTLRRGQPPTSKSQKRTVSSPLSC